MERMDWLYYSDRAQSRAQSKYDNEEPEDADAEVVDEEEEEE